MIPEKRMNLIPGVAVTVGTFRPDFWGGRNTFLIIYDFCVCEKC